MRGNVNGVISLGPPSGEQACARLSALSSAFIWISRFGPNNVCVFWISNGFCLWKFIINNALDIFGKWSINLGLQEVGGSIAQEDSL